MNKIGVVGLGIMGHPMASNLLKAGYEVSVFNRRPGKSGDLEQRGAIVCASPAEMAANCDAVVVMVKADPDVEAVVLGEGGLSAGAKPGLVILNSSTILPSTSRRLAAEMASGGIEMLDCPVTGSALQAIEAKLAFMVGGSRDAFERCKPILLAMGKAAYYLGPSGAGSCAKLANNTMYAINLLSFVEAITLVCKGGVDPELFLEIVGQGGARNIVAEQKLPKILGRDFSAAFSLAMMNKDLGLVSRLAGEMGLIAPVLETAKAVYGKALETGRGDEDLSSVVRLYEELDGQVIERRSPSGALA